MNYIIEICKSPLLNGISKADAIRLMDCLSAQKKEFERNDYIFRQGQAVSLIGLVISGRVHVVKEDFWGNRSIITQIGPGEIFAEAFSYAKTDTILFNVIAAEKTVLILLDAKYIIQTCPKACLFHGRVIENMLAILADKNIRLTQKIDHITKKTTREKLLSFLSEYAIRAGSSSFYIPFNRQEMADYLSVDRSAMSNELSKMRDEGMLKFTKNYFELSSKLKAGLD